jgi:hypothetical protein
MWNNNATTGRKIRRFRSRQRWRWRGTSDKERLATTYGSPRSARSPLGPPSASHALAETETGSTATNEPSSLFNSRLPKLDPICLYARLVRQITQRLPDEISIAPYEYNLTGGA